MTAFRAVGFVGGPVLDGSLDEPLRLVEGVSYPFDLTEPMETFDGGEPGHTRFDAGVFKIGSSADF